MLLRFITWNVKGGRERRLPFLERYLQPPTVVALQEVSPAFEETLRAWGQLDWMHCSFEKRAPKKYDGKNRMLATVVAGKGDVRPLDVALVPETLLPERALAVSVSTANGPLVACSFHALAGASFKTGKVVMFRAITRWLEEQSLPVVFGMDRNAPVVDHPDEAQIEWKWRKKHHEPLIFGPDAPHRCRDAYRTYLSAHPALLDEIRAKAPRGPLATTFMRRGTPCRYDAVYASPELEVLAVEHVFEEATDAGSDHGLVVVDLRFGQS